MKPVYFMAKETTRPVLVYDFVYSHFFQIYFIFLLSFVTPLHFFFVWF